MNKKALEIICFAIFLALSSPAWAMGKKPPRMVLGEKAEPATLFENFRPAGSGDKITVVCFLSYECPLSRVVIQSASKFLEPKTDTVAAVGFSPMKYENTQTLNVYKEQQGIAFPLYFDETAELARLFQVKTVPLFFVFDKVGVLQFRGDLGGMKEAVILLIQGKTGFSSETPAPGCHVPKRKIKLAKKRPPLLPPLNNKSTFPTDTTAQSPPPEKKLRPKIAHHWGI